MTGSGFEVQKNHPYGLKTHEMMTLYIPYEYIFNPATVKLVTFGMI